MKKYLSLALVALAVITLCLCFVSCKNDETSLEAVLEELDKVTFKDKKVVYNGKPKNLTVTTRLQYNRLPSGIKVRYEGNGNIEVGEYTVTAIFSKDGVEIPEATKTAKLTIQKATYEPELAESLENFKDTTVYYNGQVQTIMVNEKLLPDGVTVTYDFHGKEPKVAGEYEITANFSHNNTTNYEPIGPKTVKLTIEKKLLDVSAISFNRTYTIFDGNKKSIKINEDLLPDGLWVRYEGNDVISVGEHEVRAVFYTKDPNCDKEDCLENEKCNCKDPNYEAPAPLVTTLTILNEDYSSTDALVFEKIGTTGYRIKGYTGNANYLILPDTHEGLPVTEIANNVFMGCSFIYVHMPDTITSLGVSAFMNCTSLKEVYLSSNLKTIGASAFNGCTALETISLPDTITAIPATCFFGCTSLKDIKLGSNITSIGALAFRNCSSLDKLYIPKTVQTITAAAPAQAPFLGTAENFMVVLEDIKAAAGFAQHWTLISTDDLTTKDVIEPTAHALVLYNQTYEQFITNYVELRNADVTTALADSIIVGSTPISGFDSNKFEYNTFANISYGYPNVSIIAASPAALVTITQATEENGGVATINIVSADGLSEQTYTVKFTTIGTKAEIVNKNGADGVVTYVLDDGFEPTATFAKTMLQKYDFLSLSFATWTRDFATLTEQTDSDGKKSYVMDNGKYVYTRNEAKINFWNDILSGVEGRAEILSHSHTHRPWGMNDDGGEYKYVDNNGTVQTATTPKGSSSKEYYAAKQIIKDIFPQFKNLLFITPGIGVKGSDQTVNGELIVGYSHFANQVLENCIKNNVYLGARGTFSAGTNYTSRVVTKDTIKNLSTRMQLPGLMVKYEDDVTSWTNYIDKAAEMGGWAMFCIHAIEVAGESQGNWVIPQDKAEQLFAYTKDKNIWVATGSEALSYYVEWSNAKLSVNNLSNGIEVSITDGLDDSVYTTALTVKVPLPNAWKGDVKVGENTLEVHTNKDGSRFVYVDVVPDKDPIYISQVAQAE